MEWKDTTSYSRGQTDSNPSCWTLTTKHLSITVVTGHIRYPGKWVIRCSNVGIDTEEMRIPYDTMPEQAQAHAVKIVAYGLNQMLASLNETEK